MELSTSLLGQKQKIELRTGCSVTNNWYWYSSHSGRWNY